METMQGDPVLSTSDVAELLAVHPSTVKRWCEDGSFDAERTPGGHRRFAIPQVLQTAREKGVRTVLDPFDPYQPHVWAVLEEIRSRGSFRRFRALTMGWLFRGRPERVALLVETLGRHPDVPLPLLLDLGVTALMRDVGQAWREGRLGVGEEHLVTQALVETLLRLRAGSDENPAGAGREARPRAVVGSTDTGHHHLGALCVRLVLEDAGWETFYLGSAVPPEDLVSVQQSRGASLVCISFSPLAGSRDLRGTVAALGRMYEDGHPFALAVGGPAAAALAPGALEGPFAEAASFSGCAGFAEALEAGFGAGRVPPAPAARAEIAS